MRRSSAISHAISAKGNAKISTIASPELAPRKRTFFSIQFGISKRLFESMAAGEYHQIIWHGVHVWNERRQKNPELKPDLHGANLRGANLSEANVSALLGFTRPQCTHQPLLYRTFGD